MKMKIRIRLFASYREVVGDGRLEFEISPVATVADVWEQLRAQYPRLSSYTHVPSAAVNLEYAPFDTRLSDGDEVAFLPPVSGGADPGGGRAGVFKVVDYPITPDMAVEAVAHPGAGGIVTFLGVVRDNSQGRRVLYLEYDAYPEMAERVMCQIGAEIKERWGLDRVAILHRVGRLDIGEASVAIAVAAPHRAEAFEACRFAIDRLKEIVPIWKKEVWEEGGEYWVETIGDEQ